MRTFIAVDVSKEVKDELLRIQEKLKFGIFKKTNDFHITLKFLGEKTEDEVDKIIKKLSEIKFHSFTLKLSSIGVFPSRKFVRVVWVGTTGDAINQLQRLVDDKLSEIGIKQETQFLSHITIARVKKIGDLREFLALLDGIVVKPITFEVNTFSLKKSTLTPQGPIYEDLQVYDL